MVGTVNDIDSLIHESYIKEHMEEFKSPCADAVLVYDKGVTGKFYLLEKVKDKLYSVFSEYFN